MQVSDSQTPPATATAILSLTINGPTGRLNGNYVVSFLDIKTVARFCRPAASPLTALANSAAGVHITLSFTSTYSLDSTNTGPMTLTIPGLGTVYLPSGRAGEPNAPFHPKWHCTKSGFRGDSQKLVSHSDYDLSARWILVVWCVAQKPPPIAMHRLAHSEQATRVHGPTSKSTQTMTAARLTAPSFTGAFTFIDPITGRGTATLRPMARQRTTASILYRPARSSC